MNLKKIDGGSMTPEELAEERKRTERVRLAAGGVIEVERVYVEYGIRYSKMQDLMDDGVIPFARIGRERKPYRNGIVDYLAKGGDTKGGDK